MGVGTTKGEILGAEGWSMRVRLDEDTLKKVSDDIASRTAHVTIDAKLQQLLPGGHFSGMGVALVLVGAAIIYPKDAALIAVVLAQGSTVAAPAAARRDRAAVTKSASRPCANAESSFSDSSWGGRL